MDIKITNEDVHNLSIWLEKVRYKGWREASVVSEFMTRIANQVQEKQKSQEGKESQKVQEGQEKQESQEVQEKKEDNEVKQ